jgi:virginiamycin B lyase
MARRLVPVVAALVASALAPSVAAAPTVNEFDVPTANSQPFDITLGADGNLWFVEQGAPKIGRVVPANPPTITDFTTPGSLSGLQGITAGPDGNLWITGTNKVAEVPPGNPNGGTAYGGIGLADPRGIATGPDGNLWIVDAGGSDSVKRVNTAGALVGSAVSLGVGCNPRNIARGPDNNMWVTCFGNGTIVRVKGDASGATTFTLAAGSTPWDITSGPDGKLWFTGQMHAVSSITIGGTPTGYTSKGLDPFGITRGPDGALWYAEFGDSAIGRVTTAGVTSQITGLSSNSGPRYIAQGPSNTLWFTEQTANKIGRITGIAVGSGGGGGGGTGGAALPPSAPAKASFARSPSTVRVNRKRRFRFRFDATARLTGRAVFKSVRRIRVSRKRGVRRRRVTLARKSFTVPASGKVVLRIRLSKKNFRILKLNRRIRTRVTVTLKNAAGLTSKASKRVTLKRPRKRRRR